MELAPKAPNGRWSASEIDTALTVLAMNDGISIRAAKALKLTGLDVPASTLRRWRNSEHTERYLAIAKDKAPIIEAKVGRQAWENALQAAEVVAKAIVKAEQQLDDPKTDAASVAYKLSLTHGIQQDKALAVEGRPSVITAHVDAEDILNNLNNLIPGLVIDGTAEDVTE